MSHIANLNPIDKARRQYERARGRARAQDAALRRLFERRSVANPLPESDSAEAWRGLGEALSKAARLKAYLIPDAIEALGEASHRLDELRLGWGELADLIVDLEGAMSIVSVAAFKINDLLTRERAGWPKVHSDTAA